MTHEPDIARRAKRQIYMKDGAHRRRGCSRATESAANPAHRELVPSPSSVMRRLLRGRGRERDGMVFELRPEPHQLRSQAGDLGLLSQDRLVELFHVIADASAATQPPRAVRNPEPSHPQSVHRNPPAYSPRGGENAFVQWIGERSPTGSGAPWWGWARVTPPCPPEAISSDNCQKECVSRPRTTCNIPPSRLPAWIPKRPVVGRRSPQRLYRKAVAHYVPRFSHRRGLRGKGPVLFLWPLTPPAAGTFGFEQHRRAGKHAAQSAFRR